MKMTFHFIVWGTCLVGPVAAQISLATNKTLSASAPGTASVPSSNYTLTPREWQELRIARQAAFKANPDFATQATELTTRMRAFEAKLNAAIIKIDPQTKLTVDRLEGPQIKAVPAASPSR
jgi:hypothetical protein